MSTLKTISACLVTVSLVVFPYASQAGLKDKVKSAAKQTAKTATRSGEGASRIVQSVSVESTKLVGDTVGHVSERAGSTIKKGGEKAAHAADKVGDKMHEASEKIDGKK